MPGGARCAALGAFWGSGRVSGAPVRLRRLQRAARGCLPGVPEGSRRGPGGVAGLQEPRSGGFGTALPARKRRNVAFCKSPTVVLGVVTQETHEDDQTRGFNH